jgi:prephenate dehydrogenase
MKMAVQITIIGLGKIGTSAGLALSKHTDQLLRTGHDIHPELARRAQKMGALDKVAYNIPSSVAEADIVFLALPLDQIEETLELIGPDLKEGAVVMDTSPVKTAVAGWAEKFIPEKRYYVGLTPVINPAHLTSTEAGTDGGREDLFKDGLMGITTPRGTAAPALKLSADLTNLLGAKPLFMDMVEVDSLMAATHLVPQLLSASLVQATASQPGWFEGRKIAGSPYTQASGAISPLDTVAALTAASGLSKEHVVRVLDNVLRALHGLRDRIAEEDAEAVMQFLEKAFADREDWWKQRLAGDWDTDQQPQVEIPTSGSEIQRFIVGRRKKDS